MTNTLIVTVDVAPEDLPLLKHELVEIEGVLTVLDDPSDLGATSGQEGLIAAAEAGADHYREEAEYFEREGELDTADSFRKLEQRAREAISFASAPGDPLLTAIEKLLGADPTGVVRDTLWDLIENS